MLPDVVAINWGGMAAQVVYWLGYAIVVIVMLVVMYFVSNVLRFNIKVDEYPLYGSGNTGQFTVGKKKTNRAMWINNKTAWRSLYPLFNRKDREPFPPEYMYQGRQAYAFNMDGEWIPGKIDIQKSSTEMKAQLIPVPHYIRNWESLQYKKNAQEFAKQDWWSENRMIVMALIAVAVCCALGAFTVWITYKFAAPGVDQMSALTTAINSMNTIPGK